MDDAIKIVFFFCLLFSILLFFHFIIKMTATKESEEKPKFLPDIKNVSEKITEVIPNVRWAPLRGIPFERRVQTAAVLSWVFLLGNCCMIFFGSLILPVLWPLHIAYLIYLFFDGVSEKGGRRSDWFRRLSCWSYFAAYFPVKLVKVITNNNPF